MTDHTAAARCESCGMRGICSLIDNVLLCDKRCAQEKAIQLESSLATVENAKQTIQEIAKLADVSIAHTGDVFNTEIIASSEVWQEINADATLSEAEKHYKFNAFMTERILTYRAEMIEADKVKFNRGQRANGAMEYLRQFASNLHTEIKTKIYEQDKTYQPVVKPVKPKGVTNRNAKSPQERLEEAYAAMRGISLESARAEMRETKSKPAGE